MSLFKECKIQCIKKNGKNNIYAKVFKMDDVDKERYGFIVFPSDLSFEQYSGQKELTFYDDIGFIYSIYDYRIKKFYFLICSGSKIEKNHS